MSTSKKTAAPKKPFTHMVPSLAELTHVIADARDREAITQEEYTSKIRSLLGFGPVTEKAEDPEPKDI